MEKMATDDAGVDREEQWFRWSTATFGGDDARCRAAARAAAALQANGADFAAAAAAARLAWSDDVLPVRRPARPLAADADTRVDTSPLLSPDGRWLWDGRRWTASHLNSPALAQAPVQPPPAPSQGLSSWVGGATSEDLFYGQAVIVWARWILIATGLILSFWVPQSLGLLQLQLTAIIMLAFGNFYLHVQLLRGHPAIDRVVFAASAADLAVVTTLVISQGGYGSPVFVFYFAAVLGLSVAFPPVLTALYASGVVVVYGIVCLSTADSTEYPAVFTRLLMIAAIAVCGALFARSESNRRAEAIRVHESASSETNLPSGTGDRQLAPAGVE
jgi:hypothetical protein